MKSILMLEIEALQIRYKAVLETAKINLTSAPPIMVLNEITSFWFRNKKLVECALNWLSVQPFETYVFTAATNLDVNEKDHYPFLLVGSVHILDDPISKFAITSSSTVELGKQFAEHCRELAAEAIDDNLKILNNVEGCIYIFPISYMLGEFETSNKLAEQAFCSFFDDDILNMKTLCKRCSTFSEVISHLKKDADKHILLNGFEDFQISLEDRFAQQQSYLTEHGFESGFTEAKSFAFALFSSLLSASSILLVCTKYQLVPFFRYEVVFHYFTYLVSSFPDNDNLKGIRTMLTKAQIAFTVGKIFDRELFDSLDFMSFFRKCGEFNFDTKLEKSLQTQHEQNIAISLVKTISNVIEEFYKFCNVSISTIDRANSK